MRPVRSFSWLLVAGLAFGALVAVVKGQDAGVRDARSLASTSPRRPSSILDRILGTSISG
jgi:hypothetical protein